MSTQDWSRSHKGNRVQANSIPIEPVVSFFGGEVRGGVGEVRVKCLMHNDSHRSASINADKNLYYCQTCGKGGNAVNIVCIMENLEFVDGIKRAIEIASGSGAAIRTGNQSRGARRASRTWDI